MMPTCCKTPRTPYRLTQHENHTTGVAANASPLPSDRRPSNDERLRPNLLSHWHTTVFFRAMWWRRQHETTARRLYRSLVTKKTASAVALTANVRTARSAIHLHHSSGADASTSTHRTDAAQRREHSRRLTARRRHQSTFPVAPNCQPYRQDYASFSIAEPLSDELRSLCTNAHAPSLGASNITVRQSKLLREANLLSSTTSLSSKVPPK
jgi:hypothetical protein